jgi:hypothetical protein
MGSTVVGPTGARTTRRPPAASLDRACELPLTRLSAKLSPWDWNTFHREPLGGDPEGAAQGRMHMGATTRRPSSRGVRRPRGRRGRSIVATILALDEDQVLFCSCAVGCADCDDE